MAPPPGLNLADQELAERARDGDHDAIAELYRQHRTVLHRHACRMLGDEAAAQDIVQEAFGRAIAAIGRTREQLHFRAWIFRIATNLCLRQLTQRVRVTPSDELAEAASTPEPAESIEEGLRHEALARCLVEALDALSPRHRQILLLREVEELDYEELARILELSLSNVKVTLHRARARLRALFLAEQYRRLPELARCGELVRLLGESGGDKESRALERHLEGCARCRHEDRSVREIFGLLPPLTGVPPELPPAASGAGAPAGKLAATAAAGSKGLLGGLVGKLLGLGLALGLGAVGLVLLVDRSAAPPPVSPAPAPRAASGSPPKLSSPAIASAAPTVTASREGSSSSTRPARSGLPASRPARDPGSGLEPELAGGLRAKLELRAGTVRLERRGKLEVLTVGGRLERGDRLRTDARAWVALRFPGDQWLALRGRLELSDATEHGEKALRRIEVRLLEGELRVRATRNGGGMVIEIRAACRKGRCARRCELDAGEARLRILPSGELRVEAFAGYLQVRGPHATRMLAAGSAVRLGERPGFSEPLLPPPRELRPVQATGPRPPLLRWDPVAGASGYRVRIGREANLWLPEEDLLVQEPSHRPRAASPGLHFWQVVALSGESEGTPSKIYAYRIEGR